MSILLLPVGSDGQAFNDANGTPRSGAKLFVYMANTSTKATLHQDQAGLTNHTNPIILSSAGQVANGSGSVKPIFTDSGSTYDVVLAPSTDTDPPASPYFTLEDISCINDVSTSVDLGSDDTITGNTSVAAASFNALSGLSNVTASAIITLPAANTVIAGKRRRFRNGTTKNVYLQRTGADTIDGATTYRIPSYSIVEATTDNVSVWMVTIRPAHRVGDFIESGKAAAEPGEEIADGAAISRTDFAGLFAVYGTTYGVGDGSTTFNKPDRRGRGSIGAGTGTLAEKVLEASWNPANDRATVVSNTATWVTGMLVQLTTTGTLPAGLSLATDYYIIRVSATEVSFATTLALAVAGTVDGLFTDDGTGDHTITHTLSARTLGQKLGEETHANTIAEQAVHNHGVTDPTHSHTERGDTSVAGGAFKVIQTADDAGTDNATTLNTTSASATGISINNTGSSTAHNNMTPELVVNVYIKT